MAEALADDDDVTKCMACKQVFGEPRYFKCLHSFCKKCISCFQVRKEGLLSYVRCPICEEKIRITEAKVEQWIDSLPENTFIRDLLKDHTIIQCEPCKERGKIAIPKLFCSKCSELLCTECAHSHKSMKFARNHTILVLDKMVCAVNKSIFCHKHQSKTLTMYCVNHRITCCTTCRLVDHTNCNIKSARKSMSDIMLQTVKGATISEQIKTLDENDTHARLGISFRNMKNVLENKRRYCVKQREDLQSQCISCTENIQNVCLKLEELLVHLRTSNVVLDSKFKDLIHQTNIQERNITGKEHVVSECQNRLAEDIDSLSDISKILNVEYLSRQKREMEKYLSLANEDTTDTLEMKFDKVIPMILDISTPEPISVSTREIPSSIRCRLLANCVPYKTDEMRLTWSSLQHGVTQIVDLASDRILLVDNTCKQMYVYKSRDKIDCTFQVVRKPWNAVVLDKTILLSVFAPFLKQVRTDKMQFVTDLGMPDRIRCVAYYKNKLVVTSESQVIVTDLKGNTIRAFKVDNPRYIFVDRRDRFYFRNGVLNKLYCTSDSFKIIFVYSHPELKVIAGITVDTEDNIYVVGHLSNNIHQLYPDGSFNRILLVERHGLWRPIYIHFLKDDSQFLLSNDGGNNVEIYEMK